jgi:hypothetical protein
VTARIAPHDLQRHILGTNLFFSRDHRELLVIPSDRVAAEGFRWASISFMAAMSRISAKEKRRTVFCVILNIIDIILIPRPI